MQYRVERKEKAGRHEDTKISSHFDVLVLSKNAQESLESVEYETIAQLPLLAVCSLDLSRPEFELPGSEWFIQFDRTGPV